MAPPTTPSTLADWAAHCRANAARWDGWLARQHAAGIDPPAHATAAAESHAADWRALESIAVVLDSLVRDREEREMLYADQVADLHRLYGADVARLAATLPTP